MTRWRAYSQQHARGSRGCSQRPPAAATILRCQQACPSWGAVPIFGSTLLKHAMSVSHLAAVLGSASRDTADRQLGNSALQAFSCRNPPPASSVFLGPALSRPYLPWRAPLVRRRPQRGAGAVLRRAPGHQRRRVHRPCHRAGGPGGERRRPGGCWQPAGQHLQGEGGGREAPRLVAAGEGRAGARPAVGSARRLKASSGSAGQLCGCDRRRRRSMLRQPCAAPLPPPPPPRPLGLAPVSRHLTPAPCLAPLLCPQLIKHELMQPCPLGPFASPRPAAHQGGGWPHQRLCR